MAGTRREPVDDGTVEILRRMARAWGQVAARLANDEADREMERGSGPLDFEAREAAYSETSADELDRFRAAIAGLPANLVRELVARFEEAQQDDGA
jgi:hypothetical protein